MITIELLFYILIGIGAAKLTTLAGKAVGEPIPDISVGLAIVVWPMWLALCGFATIIDYVRSK
jgi:hypothetical protein